MNRVVNPLDVSEEGIKNHYCTGEHLWTFHIQFFAWYCGPGNDREDIQAVPWLLAQKKSNTFAVIASRDFTSYELIGIYLGPLVSKEGMLSKYALTTDYGTVDPGYGLDEVMAEKIYPGLGLHHVAMSNIAKEVNAYVTDEFLVFATKPISIGTEIKFPAHHIKKCRCI